MSWLMSTFLVVYPFAPFLVRDLMQIPDWRQNEVGYYSGLIASCFTLGSMFGSPLWGALSDQVGRRPVILIGLVGDFLFINLFGMASNITTALIFRFLHGLSSGNIAVAKTYLADITDSSNESAAFGLIGLTFGVGVVIGPVIGGFLSRPSVHFPHYFPPGSFFDRFPYLLPCLLVSVYVFVDLFFAFFFLDESRKRTWLNNREEPAEYSYGIAGESFPSQEQGITLDATFTDDIMSIARSDYSSVREQERSYVDRNLLETFERQAGVTPRMTQSLFSSIPSTVPEHSVENSLRTPLLDTGRSRSFLGGSPTARSIRGRRERQRCDREWDERSLWSSRESYTENRGPYLTEAIPEPDEGELDGGSKVLSSSQQSFSRSLDRSLLEKEDEAEEGEGNTLEGKSSQVPITTEDEDWFYSDDFVKSRGNSSLTSQRKESESSSFMTYGLSGSFGAATANILSPSLRPKAPRIVDRLRLDEEDRSAIQESAVEETSLFSPDEEGTVLPEPTNATIENKTFRHVLIVAVLISFTLLAGDEVIPVWASTQPRFGGLGFSSTDIGSVQTLSGVTTILVALYIFPYIARRLGVVNTIRLGLLVGSVNYLLPAVIVTFGWSRKDTMSWIIYTLFDIFLAFFEQCCWAGIALIVKNSVHPSSVGLALGLAQGLQSAGFAAGPVIGGSLFAFAISLDLPAPLSHGRSFFYLESSLLFAIFLIAASLPRWPWKVECHIRY
ncbi:MFS transporter, DHA1 family, tetracycline:hydrogen antiporter [Galdieria sulphuraria]|uniref:MFS transporter, DHA1 family, tetracycline:hydrogen antiporter n=1 Tax=Galdieria sulphuraria TaxID=130081 RepID=M2XJE9_GALSU|nr:MFS transporter, DHA1 family, tetracycline:hydrogen antiporter [Galdieria sulphuraria]EME30242.1 MFS transporter, DHA1 family, tetracycline:hydrogen antiporter [Galdieria sulphuraria]|eukprot:XP_005706762.1 MFS transporter, DHA1 family, tetracycline:hydrogen antiporter [Galdieria sulphuraria]